MKKVIFACVHNAGRSQMAAAFFNKLGDSKKVQAISAGTAPAEKVHPVVQSVMKEIGIDLSSATPQKLTEELAREATLLITMGCKENCPYVPGLKIEDWPLTDPKDQPMEKVREIRNDIKARVTKLLERLQ